MNAKTISPAKARRLSREEIEGLQVRRLSELGHAIWESNPFYRAKLESSGLTGADINSLDALRRLGFTTKQELADDQREHPPYGTNLTHPINRYSRLHQTSGTTGHPMRWLDTPESWDWITGLWAIIFEGAKIEDDDRFFFPFSFGPFLGFWAAFDAACRLGYLTLPGGAMNTSQRLHFMLDNAATVVCCTPTYALHMAEIAGQENLDLKNSPIRALIVAGEPGGCIPETRGLIEKAWGARVFDHTGMTEIGPLAFECEENPGGMHVMEPEYIIEVVDAGSGNPVRPGERGELVVTNLGRTGSPLLRYRTGDWVTVDPEPCPCGRNQVRLKGGILGRVDSMVIIRGNNLYPAALESVVRRFPEVTEYRAEVSRHEGLATLTLTVESAEQIGSNGASLADRIASEVKEAFSFRPEVRVVEPGTLPRFELKAARFIIDPSYRKESE